MSRFKFALEALLNHRLHHEEIIQKELAVCGFRVRDEQSILTRIQQDKDKAVAEIHQKQLRGVAISEHILYANFLEGLARNLVVQQEKVKESEKKYDQKQEDLIEAVKKRKTIENLKEKGLAAYSRKLLKLDQDFLDEVAICRFHKETF
ncbi:MAG: flagellar export protein FliJ [Deltaproteobacteria bacterium]|nr:flagellar export protein FliJ [Deltaproteobacteria bacterium]